MKFLVTGGAGFLGSHFCDFALNQGHKVLAFDNLETGVASFLDAAKKNPAFEFIKGDIRNTDDISVAVDRFKPDWIIHLAANADVRRGTDRPTRDLDYNTIGTSNVLEAARKSGTKRILFSSTGSVYGEPEIFPTPENCPFPIQTSFYAASKLAGEGLISAYVAGFGMTGLVFRFVSILGPRYTHGHVFDFVKALRTNPQELRVLGNGKQTKSYLHVKDLMSGLFIAIDKVKEAAFSVYNIGHDDTLIVDQSVSYITDRLGLKPKIIHTGGHRGWVGDSPRIQLDTSALKSLGWSATRTLKSAVEDTVDFLMENPALLDRRE